MPRTNLCSRPSCHEYPEKHAIPDRCALAPPTAVALFARPAEWELSLPRNAAFDGARVPLLALPASSGQAVGAASTSCYRNVTPRGSAVSRAITPEGLVSPRGARRSESLTSPRHVRRTHSASRARPPALRPDSRAPHHGYGSTDRRRLPPIGPKNTFQTRAQRVPIGPPLVPQHCACGPASDMLSRPNPRSARLNCLPVVHRGR